MELRSATYEHHNRASILLQAAMAEWLRRLTRNQMGSSRVGSNPTRSDMFWIFDTTIQNNRKFIDIYIDYFQQLTGTRYQPKGTHKLGSNPASSEIFWILETTI